MKSKRTEKSFWGMTSAQMSIVVVMAFLALLALAILGYLGILSLISQVPMPAVPEGIGVVTASRTPIRFPPTWTPTPTVSQTPRPSPTSSPSPTATPFGVPISPDNIKDITLLSRFGKGAISDVFWMPDGSGLVVTASTGVYWFDAYTFEDADSLNLGVSIFDAAISKGAKLLAVSTCVVYTRHLQLCVKPSVIIYDLINEQVTFTLPLMDGGIPKVAYGSDDNMLAISSCGQHDETGEFCTQNKVSVVEVTTGEIIGELKVDGFVVDLKYHPQNNIIAISSGDGTVQVWDLSSGNSWTTRTTTWAAGGKIAFTSDGSLLAMGNCVKSGSYGCDKGEIQLWDVKTRKISRVLGEYSGNVSGLAFSTDGSSLAIGTSTIMDIYMGSNNALVPEESSVFASMATWNLEDGSIRYRLNDYTRNFVNIDFKPGEQVLAVGSQDAGIRLIDNNAGNVSANVLGFTSNINSIALSHNGKLLVTGGYDGVLRMWAVETQQLLYEIQAYRGVVSGVAFSSDDRILVSSGGFFMNTAVYLWDVQTGKQKKKLFTGNDIWWINNVAISPNGARVAAGDLRYLIVWSTSNGIFDRYMQNAVNIAFRQDGRLALVDYSGQFFLWDVSKGKVIYGPTQGLGSVNNFAISSQAASYAIAGYFIWVGEAQTDKKPVELHIADAYGERVNSVALTSDGKVVAAALDGGTYPVVLGTVENGELVRTLMSHTGDVRVVVISEDDRWILSGSADGTVNLWGVP